MEINPYSDICFKSQQRILLPFVFHQVMQWDFSQTYIISIETNRPDPLEVLANCFGNRAKKRGSKIEKHTWKKKGYELSRRK